MMFIFTQLKNKKIYEVGETRSKNYNNTLFQQDSKSISIFDKINKIGFYNPGSFIIFYKRTEIYVKCNGDRLLGLCERRFKRDYVD